MLICFSLGRGPFLWVRAGCTEAPTTTTTSCPQSQEWHLFPFELEGMRNASSLPFLVRYDNLWLKAEDRRAHSSWPFRLNSAEFGGGSSWWLKYLGLLLQNFNRFSRMNVSSFVLCPQDSFFRIEMFGFFGSFGPFACFSMERVSIYSSCYHLEFLDQKGILDSQVCKVIRQGSASQHMLIIL